MDVVERGQIVLEIAALIARLDDERAGELAEALARTGGPDELLRLIKGFYRLPDEVRASLLREFKARRRPKLHP